MRVFIRILLIAIAAGIAPLAVALVPKSGAPVVVIASPFGHGALAVVAAADGRLVAATRFESIVVGVSDEPDFLARLRKAGAFLLLDGRGLTGCLTT